MGGGAYINSLNWAIPQYISSLKCHMVHDKYILAYQFKMFFRVEVITQLVEHLPRTHVDIHTYMYMYHFYNSTHTQYIQHTPNIPHTHR